MVMKAEEIRKFSVTVSYGTSNPQQVILRELAAQVAELVAVLKKHFGQGE